MRLDRCRIDYESADEFGKPIRMTEQAPEPPFDLVIEAGKSELHYWQDLWRYRELFMFLAWRDIVVRYKQTVIGVLWALIRPLLNVVIMTFVFGNVAKLAATETVPYPLLVLAGSLPWQLFSTSLSSSSQSLVAAARLISKVYFPRLMIPTSNLAVSIIDFAVAFLMMLIAMAIYGVPITWRILAVIPLVGFTALAAMSVGIWLSALNVTYRDFRFLIPILIQGGLFVSPVGYTSARVGDGLGRFFYSLNPMVGVIDGFRWALVGQGEVYWTGFAISGGLVVLFLMLGIRYFRRMERTFADVI